MGTGNGAQRGMARGPQHTNGGSKVLRWAQIVGTVIAAFVATVGVLWYIFGAASAIQSQAQRNEEFQRRLIAIETALSTMQSTLSGLSAEGTAQTARNIDSERRLGNSVTTINSLQNSVTAIQRDLNEVETQFCEADHLRNLMHANDLRWFAMLFDKSFGAKLPTDNTYYPIVCNRKAAQ